jgi:redox-sensitive bicupin YhaK (pirin superfamily)
MKLKLHKADTRGAANHGWLDAKHTFSFADYQNSERMGFGKLRVLNDDVIEPSMGFDTHPHKNMEIVSIPIFGSLRHWDSIGNQSVIRAGEVQIMSAGTGVNHSEYNDSDTDKVNLLQIWVYPKVMNVEPRYEQKEFLAQGRNNQFQLTVSPDGEAGSVSINQKAYFSLANLDSDQSIDYKIHENGYGVYVFVIDGSVNLDKQLLESRDGAEVTDTDNLNFKANENTQLLCIEIPL